ncbi:alpha/beta fold hydrolase [Nonomuraea sp. NPDC050786]|uniref:alpha/beta fold hydrolase n=1 Tax=Nonomuraea sp. NPDC050786 TaxID=3154840 RepID=UPI0033C34070
MQNVNIWSEEFGAETDAPILLIMGSMSQGILWPDEFAGRLTAGDRRVIRYDHRDTGMSGTVDFEAEPYTWDDIKNDVYRVMDDHGLESAHLVCHSAGGLLGQFVAVERPERVRSLTVIGSSPLGGGEGQVIMRGACRNGSTTGPATCRRWSTTGWQPWPSPTSSRWACSIR